MIRKYLDHSGGEQVLLYGDDQGFSESQVEFEIGKHSSGKRGITGRTVIDGEPCALFAEVPKPSDKSYAFARRRLVNAFAVEVAARNPVPMAEAVACIRRAEAIRSTQVSA